MMHLIEVSSWDTLPKLSIQIESLAAFLKESLDEYVSKLPVSTKIFRLKEREGLIAARLLGAKHAQGVVYHTLFHFI